MIVALQVLLNALAPTAHPSAHILQLISHLVDFHLFLSRKTAVERQQILDHIGFKLMHNEVKYGHGNIFTNHFSVKVTVL